MSLFIVYLLFAFYNFDNIYAKITCKNNDGNPIDWFIVYKLPRGKSVKLSNGEKRNGTEFAYMDPTSTEWQIWKNSINSTQNAVYYTLQQIYDNEKSNDVFYVMYNDQKPTKEASSSRGHSKGDVAFDSQTGFWLIHSVPRFPPYLKDKYSYPETGTVYGQTMLCISLAASALPSIAQQLTYIYAAIYEKNIPQTFLGDPAVQALQNDDKITSPPWNRTAPLTSSAGQKFISFAKSTNFGKDLYDALVAPGLKSDLLVETWKNGEVLLPSNCSIPYKVINVEDLVVANVKIGGKADHAKWAIAGDQVNPWVCIGDINRQATQFKRGGGTACAQLPAAWKAFMKSITDMDQCPHCSNSAAVPTS